MEAGGGECRCESAMLQQINGKQYISQRHTSAFKNVEGRTQNILRMQHLVTIRKVRIMNTLSAPQGIFHLPHLNAGHCSATERKSSSKESKATARFLRHARVRSRHWKRLSELRQAVLMSRLSRHVSRAFTLFTPGISWDQKG